MKALPNIPEPPKGKKLGEFFKWRKSNLVSKDELNETGKLIENRAAEKVGAAFQQFASRIEGLEKSNVETQRKIQEYVESRLSGVPSKADFENISRKLESGLQLVRTDVIGAAENAINSRIKKINDNLLAIEQKIKGDVKTQPKQGNANTDLNELKNEVAGLRDMLITEVRVIKEEEIPFMAKSVASGMSSSLAKMEKEGELAVINNSLAELGKKIDAITQKNADENEAIRNWLKKMEQEFNEELSKVIEWINYFRSGPNLEIEADSGNSGGIGAAQNRG